MPAEETRHRRHWWARRTPGLNVDRFSYRSRVECRSPGLRGGTRRRACPSAEAREARQGVRDRGPRADQLPLAVFRARTAPTTAFRGAPLRAPRRGRCGGADPLRAEPPDPAEAIGLFGRCATRELEADRKPRRCSRRTLGARARWRLRPAGALAGLSGSSPSARSSDQVDQLARAFSGDPVSNAGPGRTRCRLNGLATWSPAMRAASVSAMSDAADHSGGGHDLCRPPRRARSPAPHRAVRAVK